MYLTAIDGAVLGNVSVVVQELFTVLSTVVTTVTGNAVLCIGLAATVGGIGISWYKRLTNQKRKG